MKTMTTHKSKLLSVLLALVLVAALNLTPLTAFAWNESTEGNSTSNNSSSVQGQTSGETSVQGWIGTFDGEENPNRPDPPAEAWINVKIPTTALFGSLASDNGDIYSPIYHIYNNSVRSVEITPTAFNVVAESTELSGMTLDLGFSAPSNLTVPLRNASDQFLGDDITNTSFITLGAGSTSNPTTATFDISGQLPLGFAYPENTPYQPTYGLVFAFEAQE